MKTAGRFCYLKRLCRLKNYSAYENLQSFLVIYRRLTAKLVPTSTIV